MAKSFADKGWKLIYWHFPNFGGRGDLARLMFEEAGVPYEDVGRNKGLDYVLKFYQDQLDENTRLDGPPVLFLPYIQNNEGLVLSQSTAILYYLGKLFGLFPEGGIFEEALAVPINATVADYMEEAHNAMHPIDRTASAESQKEAAIPFIESFKQKRMTKFLPFLEACLKYNRGGDGYFFGEKVTFVDIAVFHALRGTEFHFPDEYKSLDIPKLRAFKERVAQRPNIAAFLKSDRAQGCVIL